MGHQVVAPSDCPQAIELSRPRVVAGGPRGIEASNCHRVCYPNVHARVVFEWSCHQRHRVII